MSDARPSPPLSWQQALELERDVQQVERRCADALAKITRAEQAMLAAAGSPDSDRAAGTLRVAQAAASVAHADAVDARSHARPLLGAALSAQLARVFSEHAALERVTVLALPVTDPQLMMIRTDDRSAPSEQLHADLMALLGEDLAAGVLPAGAVTVTADGVRARAR